MSFWHWRDWRLSIRQKLLGAFAVDLVLLFLLGAVAYHGMGFMNERAASVETMTIPALATVDLIQDQVDRYRTLQLEYLIHRSLADQSRIEGSMLVIEGEMNQALARLRELLPGSASGDAVAPAIAHVSGSWQAYVEANHERFLPSARLGNGGAVQPALSRLNPLHQELSQAVGKLAELNQKYATEALQAVRDTYRSSSRFILADTVFSLIVSAAIGLALAATLASRVRRLTEAARRVSSGDLGPRLEPSGGDEIQTLTESFNEMVRSLRQQRIDLDIRHRELKLSLRRQQMLTDDLMRRKEAEEVAVRARAAAEAASEAKSLFLATMSHELRTPLNAILGFAQLMALSAQARGEKINRDLERIQAAGRHLLSIISNILDFSKIEQGKMELDLIEVDLDKLLHEVAQVIEPLALERGNKLDLVGADNLGIVVSDPAKLRQILFNLLSNAVKFTQDGQVQLRARRDRAAHVVELAVEDNGIGIAPETLGRLFEPFAQADNSTTRRFGGTGLGLLVSRQMIEMLGGQLLVASEPDLGSKFTVTLPDGQPAQNGGSAKPFSSLELSLKSPQQHALDRS